MATTRTLTEFLQHSGEILPEVEHREVVLRRRSGDDLVIVSREHWQALEDSLRVLAEAYHHSRAADRSEAGEEPAWFALPWLSLLRPEDRQACVAELTRAALAALEAGRLPALAETLDQWRATALATWDADRAADSPDSSADAPFPLPRP